MNSTNYVLNYIGKEKIKEIDMFILDMLSREYKSFASNEDIVECLEAYIEKYKERLSYQEQQTLKSYTGLAFRRINSILRGSWDYEINGALTPEIKAESNQLADAIRTTLMKSESLPMDMKVYRGVSLSTFRAYGVNSLSDLKKMENKYMYEDGFTSTTLIREESFFYKQTEWGEKANIEVEYLIPNESDDGAFLNDASVSFSPNQDEYLINSGSLFKVISVDIDEKTNQARVRMALVPQKVWSPYDYEMERKSRGLVN